MRYIAAFLLPPFAVAICWRTMASLVNLFVYILAWLLVLVFGLGFIFYMIAAIHACLVVSQFYADRRAEELKTIIVAAQSAVSTALTPAPSPPEPPAAALPASYDPVRDTWRID